MARGDGFGVRSRRVDRIYLDGALGTAVQDASEWLAFPTTTPSSADAFSGADSGTLVVHLSSADSSSLTAESSSAHATLSSADSSSQAADAGGAVQAVSSADTAGGLDGKPPAIGGTDAGSASETASYIVQLAVSDASSLTADGGEKITFLTAEAASGLDAQSIQAFPVSADSVHGADAGEYVLVMFAAAETGTLADLGAVSSIYLADADSGSVDPVTGEVGTSPDFTFPVSDTDAWYGAGAVIQAQPVPLNKYAVTIIWAAVPDITCDILLTPQLELALLDAGGNAYT